MFLYDYDPIGYRLPAHLQPAAWLIAAAAFVLLVIWG